MSDSSLQIINNVKVRYSDGVTITAAINGVADFKLAVSILNELVAANIVIKTIRYKDGYAQPKYRFNHIREFNRIHKHHGTMRVVT